ncbi:hypothetical protein JHK86_034007 [Glycine max]|nr:hypothetical protein JHK86_034007 [Glycine max]
MAKRSIRLKMVKLRSPKKEVLEKSMKDTFYDGSKPSLKPTLLKVLTFDDGNEVRPNLSYANVTQSYFRGNTRQKRNGSRVFDVQSFHMSYKANLSTESKLGRAYVSRVVRVGDSYITKKKLHLEGIFGIGVTLIGSSLVLLETEDLEEVGEYINVGADWVTEWFEEIMSWKLTIIDNERLV